MDLLKNILAKASGIIEPNEARILAEHFFELSREKIYLSMDKEFDESPYSKAVQRRKLGEPIAKIIGYKEFYGRRFKTNEHTLDPRPDSECLVEAMLGIEGSVLELGVGTGCLIITLAKEMQKVYSLKAIDISSEALKVAQENAREHEVDINFENIGWLDFESNKKFDIVISNPPYISQNDYDGLDFKAFEPREALTDNGNGLTAYKQIASRVNDFLKDDGDLFLEIGKGQELDVESIFNRVGLRLVEIHKDLAGISRCLHLRKQGNI